MSEAVDWVEQARRLVAGLGGTGLGATGPAGAGPAWTDTRGDGHDPGGDCRWCPVCQLAAVARRPEVSEALADALTSAAAALRAFAAAAAAAAAEAGTEPSTEAGAPEPPAAPGPAPQERPVREEPAPVQHIEIG